MILCTYQLHGSEVSAGTVIASMWKKLCLEMLVLPSISTAERRYETVYLSKVQTTTHVAREFSDTCLMMV